MSRRVVVLVAFLLLAVGPVGVWWLTRPGASDGPPVTSVAAGSTAQSPAASPSAAASSAASGPAPVATRKAALPAAAAVTAPARLNIPDLDVDAAVLPVGVDDAGAMVVPKEAKAVGWYRYGPAPGSAAGAAVIAGHVDAKQQGAGALFRLRELRVGDAVTVTATDGRRTAYRVSAKETIVKKRLPTERLFARDGGPRLVLITCGGPFLPELASYRDNVVVVALPVQGQS